MGAPLGRSRWIGLALVVVAFGVLIGTADRPGPWILPFLALFVPGMLLLTGILGRPRGLPSTPPVGAGVVRPATTTDHRYRTGWLGYAVVWFLGLSLVAAGAGFLLAVQPGPGGGRETIGLVAAILVAPGLGFVLYAWRRPRTRIRVGPDGIACFGVVRTIRIPWSEVVALRAFTVRTGDALDVGRIYRVFSGTRTITFSDSIRERDDLLAAIAAATGLDWE